MNGPPEIWIDERVVRNMSTAPDPHALAGGVPELRYINEERVTELVLGSQGTEFFIQIELGKSELIGLTNYGRIFTKRHGEENWLPIDVPDFTK